MKSLKDIDKKLVCSLEQLDSLEGCPEGITYLDCSGNNLINLEGCASTVITIKCDINYLESLKGISPNVKQIVLYNNRELEDISDLPIGVTSLDIEGCPNIKVFPKHIGESLTLYNASNKIIRLLKEDSRFEVEETHSYLYYDKCYIIKEKSLGNQLLENI